ncbi:MAG: 3-dehydroquinate synthase [Bacteroidales bacterium]|nr:3-dehydroquinate synthase [Bacteroidales bacterium]
MLKPITYQHARGECKIIFNPFSLFVHQLPQNSVFIVDKNVYQLYLNIFNKIKKPIYIYQASEKRKTLKSLEYIFNFFYDNAVDRGFTIAVVGGGITCDIGAMAASLWKRGCKLVLVPTTLLAMIDAAIGGKTAINFHSIKNSVGTFYHADKIWIDTKFLNTLPIEIYTEGIPEIIKHALSLNKNLLEQLIKINADSFGYLKNISDDIIYENIITKLSIVTSDPEEKNIRKILNVGHTVGHAFELSYGLPHGIAVANGILVELETFNLLGYIDDPSVLTISKTLLKPFISNKIKKEIEPLLPFLLQDKKRNMDEISIPIVKSIGNTIIQNIQITDFTKALQEVLLNER